MRKKIREGVALGGDRVRVEEILEDFQYSRSHCWING